MPAPWHPAFPWASLVNTAARPPPLASAGVQARGDGSRAVLHTGRVVRSLAALEAEHARGPGALGGPLDAVVVAAGAAVGAIHELSGGGPPPPTRPGAWSCLMTRGDDCEAGEQGRGRRLGA